MSLSIINRDKIANVVAFVLAAGPMSTGDLRDATARAMFGSSAEYGLRFAMSGIRRAEKLGLIRNTSGVGQRAMWALVDGGGK